MATPVTCACYTRWGLCNVMSQLLTYLFRILSASSCTSGSFTLVTVTIEWRIARCWEIFVLLNVLYLNWLDPLWAGWLVLGSLWLFVVLILISNFIIRVDLCSKHLINDLSVDGVVNIDLINHSINLQCFIALPIPSSFNQLVLGVCSLLFESIHRRIHIQIIMSEFVHKVLLVLLEWDWMRESWQPQSLHDRYDIEFFFHTDLVLVVQVESCLLVLKTLRISTEATLARNMSVAPKIRVAILIVCAGI